MKINIENFKIFYSSFLGKSITQIILKKIHNLWPSFNNSRNAVIGFGFPFLSVFKSNIQRLFFLVPNKFGLFNFFINEKNLTASVQEDILPLEDLSIDRLLVVNCFEYLSEHKKFLREAWRILDKDGFRDTDVAEKFVYTYMFDLEYEKLLAKFKKSMAFLAVK